MSTTESIRVIGDACTLWSVRISIVMYVFALLLRFTPPSTPQRLQHSRQLWTAAYLLLVVHMLCAFHFFHNWSHQAAWQSTARQTRDVLGLEFGTGLYVNYSFALIWAADVVWWWRFPASYHRRHFGIEILVQGFLTFVTFNATVVFGKGVSRWLGIVACLLALTSVICRAPAIRKQQ